MKVNENKQANENISLLKEIVEKLEWSKLYWRGPKLMQVHVCPVCMGIKPSEYTWMEKNGEVPDVRYHKGHQSQCLYKKLQN